MKRSGKKSNPVLAAAALVLLAIGIGAGVGGHSSDTDETSQYAQEEPQDASESSGDVSDPLSDENAASQQADSPQDTAQTSSQQTGDTASASFDLSQVPAYSGSAETVVNGNRPFFSEEDFTNTTGLQLSPLDSLGRCGVCTGMLGPETLPTEERGEIGSVRPSGWHTVKYDGISGRYLYNRCHLIAFCLSGLNAEPRNLITGTRYLNTEGMLPNETLTCDYIKDSGNHVLYRVTPVFEGSNLVASGVLMEGESVEDRGAGLCFCVYCYNVQPGISIDYATGDSSGPQYTGSGN